MIQAGQSLQGVMVMMMTLFKTIKGLDKIMVTFMITTVSLSVSQAVRNAVKSKF